MNLVSIDLLIGRLRAYESVAGGPPKLRATVDIPGYEEACADGGFVFDEKEIESYRRDPEWFIATREQPMEQMP